jgi:hypothetical protein
LYLIKETTGESRALQLVTRARDGHHGGLFKEPWATVPGRKISEAVCSHEKEEFSPSKALLLEVG